MDRPRGLRVQRRPDRRLRGADLRGTGRKLHRRSVECRTSGAGGGNLGGDRGLGSNGARPDGGLTALHRVGNAQRVTVSHALDRVIVAGGVRTRVREAGRGQAVLLIHGFADTLGTWWRALPVLARRYRCIAYDLHGCGASEKGPGAYEVAALGDQAVGVLDALGVERAHVVGHSLGAKVALAAAALAPERVRSLVLEAPPAFAMELPWELRLLTAPLLGELIAACATPWTTRMATRRAFLRMVHPQSRTWSEERRQRLPIYDDDPRAVVTGWMHLARGIALHREHPLEERYASIDAPALLITGESDPNVPSSQAERLARALPHARLVRYARAGHVPHAECDQDFAADLLRFFDQQERAQGSEVPRGG
ncbi:alpha/beta hydrolase [bacterium]|nr:MAG: alpha/beta hydrolase [bacterium]